MAQDHLAIFDEACLVGSDLLSQRRDLPVGVRVCGQRTSVSPGRRCAGTAEGAAAPPANAGRDSKQLVTADPAEKMAARRPGDAAGALNAAAVATSSPTMRSRQHERIASEASKSRMLWCPRGSPGGEGENVAKGRTAKAQSCPTGRSFFDAEQPVSVRRSFKLPGHRSESDLR